MKFFFRITLGTFFSSLILFSVLETVCRWSGQPSGTNRFAEKIIIRDHLSTRKPKGEFRIFAFGESTFHGAHYAPVSSPPRWLEKYLKDFLPGRNIRVINFARMGRGAYFAYETFKETLPYQPDLAIMYLGHNAFLPQSRKSDVEAVKKTFRCAVRRLEKQSALFSTVYRYAIRQRIRHNRDKPEDRIEMPKIEMPPHQLLPDRITPRESPAYRQNVEFFRENIRELLKLATTNRVPILFMKPVSNLKDFSPTLSVHKKNLTPSDELRWKRFYETGRKNQAEGRLTQAREDYAAAYQIDSAYAELSFRLGQIYLQQGEKEKAKRFFGEARDKDAVIIRATREILKVFEELTETENLQLLDTERVLISEVPSGIMGEPAIEDNAHFSVRAQAKVARYLAEEIAKRGFIAPVGEWQFQKERSFEEMSRELGVSPEILFSADLKMVYYFGSRFGNRIRFARKALAIHPRDPSALRHLAWTYWLMGKKVRALQIYWHLRQADPKNLNEIFSNLNQLKGMSDDYGASRLTDDLDGMIKSGFFGRPK